MRFVLIYALTVGAPLVALLLVLRAGERLDAPASFGGVWRLEGAGVPAEAARLELVQSGRVVELRLGHARGRGHLRDDEGLVGAAGAWVVRARRVADGRLEGDLARADAAVVTTFSAARVSGPRSEGAGEGH